MWKVTIYQQYCTKHSSIPFHAYGSQKGVGNWQNSAKNVKRQKLTFGDYHEKCTISVNCIFLFLKGVFLKIHKYIQVLGLNEDVIQ